MNRTATLNFLVVAGIFAWPGNLSANGLRIASQDGFASARGEAFVATADNPSAIYYNPAGISQLEGSHIRGGIYGIHFDPTYQPPCDSLKAGNVYHLKHQFAVAPNFFYTCGVEQSRWDFGLGIYAPFGGSLSWPQNTGFRAVALQSSLQFLTINPVIAFKLTPTLSLGGGVMMNYGNVRLEQGLRRFQNPALPDFFRFNGDGWGAGFNLGMLWQPDQKVSFGASFRSTTKVGFNGHTDFVRPPQISETRLSARTDFNFPLTAVFGISYRPTSRWNLEFDADYTDWSSLGTTAINQATPPSGWPPYLNQWPKSIPVTLNWKASWMYEFGVTRYFDAGWHLSAGYVFNENSVPDKFYLPTTADLPRHFFSVGAGRKYGRFEVDVAYQLGFGPKRTVTGSDPPFQPVPTVSGLADGSYDFMSHAFFLTVGMRF